MQTITVNLNLSRGFCRITQPLYLGETVSVSFSEAGAYSLILTEPFAAYPDDGVTVWAQSTDGGVLALNRKALHSAFKKADAMQPNMTVTAKGFVISDDGQTVADGEVTIEYSPKAFIIDENEYPLAREVLAQAENAKNSAVSAKTAAEEAKSKAEGAQSAAEKARDEARSARNEAKEAKTGAENALSAAKESAATASAAKDSAITAQNASEAARDAAQNAQEAAETARDDAGTIASDTATKLVEASEKRLQDQIINIAAEEVAKVVANAPQDLDTLKEIADYIESDKTGAAQMVTQIAANAKAISDEAERAQKAETELDEEIAKKVDAEEGKGLSSNDFTNEAKAKLESLSDGYKLAEVGEDCLLLDRASNHATEERNTRDVWKTVDEVVVPSDRFTFDASSGRITYEEYGTRVIANISQFDFDNPLLPDGSYDFYGGRALAQGEATFTPTSVATLEMSGSWTGDATWTDPISGATRTTKITNGSFSNFYVETPPSTAEQPLHIAYGSINEYAPTVGEVLDVVEAYDENGEEISSTLKVVISSVNTTRSGGDMIGILSFPEYGLNANVDMGIPWNTDEKVFSVNYNFETPGKELTTFLSFPLSSAPTKGAVYHNSVSEINVLCSFAKSSKVELIPPGPVPDRLRDFIVVFDAQTDGRTVEMPGVKEADEDVLKMEIGRNAIFVTEFVQGEMYATRKLLEAPAS